MSKVVFSVAAMGAVNTLGIQSEPRHVYMEVSVAAKSVKLAVY